MADKLDNLKNAKCLVEAWEQKYGIGGHHSKWVNLRPSDVEWAVAEIERLREALKPFAEKFLYPDDTGFADEIRADEDWSEEYNESQVDDVMVERSWIRKARNALEGK